MYSWYLIYTKPRDDLRAELQLSQQNYRVFRPKIRFHKLCKGSQTTVCESLFPRYLFIYLHEANTNWLALRSTRGVNNVIGFGGLPTKVPDQVVESVLELVDDDGILDRTIKEKTLFQYGDVVEVIDGSFRGYHALVHSQTGKERVTILLTMLGQQQRISVPIAQVRPGNSLETGLISAGSAIQTS